MPKVGAAILLVASQLLLAAVIGLDLLNLLTDTHEDSR